MEIWSLSSVAAWFSYSFLNIRDALKEIETARMNLQNNTPQFNEIIYQLQQLIRTEMLLSKQISLIAKIKEALSRKLINPSIGYRTQVDNS